MALVFAPISPVVGAANGVINIAALGANAEISAFNPVSGYLYTVGGGSGGIVVSDLRNPAAPMAVARAVPADGSQTLQSAAVFGRLLAVAVQNSVKTEPGFVQFYDLTDPALPRHLSTVTVGALPDMVKFSADGTRLLVTNEGEPNTTYTIDPLGSISVISTAGYLAPSPVAPVQADVRTVDFTAWDGRRAELINRGIRITGKAGVTTSLSQDLEPEAIAIAADGKTAYISLQENNAIAVLDISTAMPRITSIFSAGIQDWDRGRATATNHAYTLSYAAGDANLPAGVQAGGLSGLWFDGVETVDGQSLDIYYSITDRGPNGALIAGQRQFLDPDFQPSIFKLGMDRASGMVVELGKIGLKRADGTPLTGLPQLAGKDEIPVDAKGNLLAYDPFGIDSETVALFNVTIAGTSRKVFAVGDEYRGQIALFDAATGSLVQRYIPAGQKALLQAQHGTLIGAETIDSLPAIYGNRWSNRGIEGMAFNSNDGLLYAFMQSPLDVDSSGDGVAAERSLSQLTRILAINPATGAPVKEHLYLLSGRSGQDKIGDVAFDPARNVFLVMERDSSRALNGFKSVYEVDLRGATNTLPLTLASQVNTNAFPAQTYLLGTEGRAVFREVIDAGEQGNNGYRFNGIPDGIGVADNGDGTLRVLVAHEMSSSVGDVRAHGSKGAYVSDLTIDKASLSVISGKDFLSSANDLFLASADGSSWSSGVTTAFSRFCSADLAAATAFRNGSTGYNGRIFLTGEEAGVEGRAFAHVLDGSDAGKVYELPSLGNLSFENLVANPLAQDKTVVVSLDDTSTNGQVYVYVGSKSSSGNAVQQAGLAGGITYGVRINAAGTTNTEVGSLSNPNETGLGLSNGVGTFELVNLGDVKAKTGAELNAQSISAGVTNWLRPEDGAWSKDGKTFYFVTTASSIGASRLWALEFTNPANPEAGGTVRMLLNGSEGQVMLDNMTVADDGSILLQEDPGNIERTAKIWRYNPSSDTLVELAQHNPALFTGAGAITQDEESSGIVDISSFLTGVNGYDTSKYSYFLVADQIHKAVSAPTSQVEIGELSVMATAKADAKQQMVPETAFPAQTYLLGTEGRAVFREVIDAGEQGNNGYRFNGIPDGIGVADNGDGTLRVLVAHEMSSSVGDVRAHGSKGAYVSDLTIDKASLSVISGKDFLSSANDLFLASADGSSWSSGVTTAFSRFCSADLAAATAFRNGSTGYNGRIFLTGEEAGVEGRAFAHVLDGSDAGKVYELPSLGNLSFENLVANPLAQDKTVVVSLDDTSTNGQVYVYVGSKSSSGNAVQQAGLAGGITYGVRINAAGTTNTEVGSLSNPNETGLGLSNGVGTFELVNLGDVKAKTGAELNAQSISAGVTNWLRPEDGAWSKDGKTFYFVTTASSIGASRLWALEFTNPANPEAGGTVRMLLNGSEGQVMLDNMTVADDGSILLQEDPGNIERTAKIWRYNPSSDTLVELAQHNPALFTGAGAITQDEESSGIVDISSFLTGVNGYDTSKYSYFLVADQIHKAVSAPTSQVEIGELSVMATAKAVAAPTASWMDAIGVTSPELLDNSRSQIVDLSGISRATALFGYLAIGADSLILTELTTKTAVFVRNASELSALRLQYRDPASGAVDPVRTQDLPFADLLATMKASGLDFGAYLAQLAALPGLGLTSLGDGVSSLVEFDAVLPIIQAGLTTNQLDLATLLPDALDSVAPLLRALILSLPTSGSFTPGVATTLVKPAAGGFHVVNPPMASADRLAAAGIQLVNKVELFNLPSVGGTLNYDKPEGLTLRNDGALVINYDNDFGAEGASGNSFTVVTFSNPSLDTEDTGDGGGYKPANNHDVYGLVMPDGLATFTYNGETFLLAAGEGDDRNDFIDPDETLRLSTLLTAAANATVDQKAGLLAANAQRLYIFTNTGDLDRDGIVDQAYALGSRSLRIFDSKGNIVFDSGSALEELAMAKGLYPVNSREDDKGVEPEMVEVFSHNGRTYAIAALERASTSMAAIFDVTNPYAPQALDPIVFPGAQRVEGITLLSTSTNAARSVIASSEGNDVVSVVDFPIPYRLQLLHLSDGEAGLLASQTAPYLAALVDGFDHTHANTLILAGGDNFLPGPFLNAGTDISVRDELNAVTGSTLSLSASINHPIGSVDIAIHNLIGVEASAIGNHEFDLGARVFRDAFMPSSGWVGAQFPYLSANLDFSADVDLASRFTNTVADVGLEEASTQKGRIVPSAVVTKNGEKIGLVGATTQILEQISSVGGVEVKGFSGDGAERDDMALLASQLQPVIDDLISQGVNKVILMSHLQQIGNEKALAPLLRGVDIILAAGSNTRLGDSSDQPVAFPGHAANFADSYPLVTQAADGAPTLIVNTDNEYTYLGRLIVDFDARGRVIPGSIDPSVSGAYAATAATVAKAWNVPEDQLASTAFAEGSKAGNVQDLSDAVQAVISDKDGQVWGYTQTYLEGERLLVRSEQTNLGDLTADANLSYAQKIDPSVVISLKNGGGIRSQIGSIDVSSGDKEPPFANPSAGKAEGGISTLDIENSLRFNNGLTLVTVTASELRALLEHGIASYPGQGRFPQLSGLAFSFDLSLPVGARIVNLAIQDAQGRDLDVVVRAGDLVGDPARGFRMVTLNYLASGGDGYPFPADAIGNVTGPANRVDLFHPDAPATGAAAFSGDGTEQDALAEYLNANHGTPAQAYAQAESPASEDSRLQNLALRADEVVDVKVGTAESDDSFSSDGIRLQGFDGRNDVLFTGAGADQVDTAILGGSDNRIFTGTGADVVYAGTRDLITGGSGNDEVWATEGDGNRISTGLGDDVIVLGSGANRALAGPGHDRIYVLDAAAGNYLNGGAGSDQFWLVSAPGDRPAAKQFVMDFKPGEDRIGLQDVRFADLGFLQVGTDTLLSLGGLELAHIANASAVQLASPTHFSGLA